MTDEIGRRWSGDDKSIRVHRRIRLMKVTAGPASHSAVTQSYWWVCTIAHVCSYWILHRSKEFNKGFIMIGNCNIIGFQ